MIAYHHRITESIVPVIPENVYDLRCTLILQYGRLRYARLAGP